MPAGARATEPEAARPRGLSKLQPRNVALLHAGAVVDVWRADVPPDRTVAIKAVTPAWLSHPGALALLRAERDLLQRLRHPRIVGVVDSVDTPAACAVALEYLGCGDLVSLAGSAPHRWLAAAIDVVEALGHVHGAGYVHGDVKARNVLFETAERAKLVDFGSAVGTGQPLPRGGRTPEHLPRDARLAAQLAGPGAPAAPELDVHALAVLLYELMAGRLPTGERPGEPLDAAVRAAPALRPLAGQVLQTLAARDVADVGTLTAFRDVLESVRSLTA